MTVRYDGADMSRPAAIEAMMHKALAEFGTIDLLVNNAGIQHVAAVDEFPLDKWEAILAINLSANFHTVRPVTTLIAWMVPTFCVPGAMRAPLGRMP